LRDGLEDLLRFFLREYVEEDACVMDVGATSDSCKIIKETNRCPTSLSYTSLNLGCETIQDNIMSYNCPKLFDAIWCSHVLEHSTNIGLFIRKLVSITKPGGAIAIVVPNGLSRLLVGGHLNFFHPGTLAYHIVLSGQNLSKATIIKHKNNISIFWKRTDLVLPCIKYDRGDLELLSKFFPIPVGQYTPDDDRWDRVNCVNFDDPFDRFVVLHYKMMQVCVTDLADRYYDVLQLWDRHQLILSHVQKLGSGCGLDFGPGTCASLIIGNLFNVPVKGLDILQAHHGVNKFADIQKKVLAEGYDMCWHDTTQYPWPLLDNSFDFVICSDSIFVDWTTGDDWKEFITEGCNHPGSIARVLEIIRVLKPEGCLYIRGGSNWGVDIDKLLMLNIHSLKKVKLFTCEHKIVDYGIFPT